MGLQQKEVQKKHRRATSIGENPELLEYVQAPYPEEAQAEGREGVVLLLIEIDEAGDVSYIEVLQSAGEDLIAAVAAAWICILSS